MRWIWRRGAHHGPAGRNHEGSPLPRPRIAPKSLSASQPGELLDPQSQHSTPERRHENESDTEATTRSRTPATIERILATEEELIPSSGFLASVMERVHEEARTPAPIPFPWKRAVPGIAARRRGLRMGRDSSSFREAIPAVRAIYVAPAANLRLHRPTPRTSRLGRPGAGGLAGFLAPFPPPRRPVRALRPSVGPLNRS